MLSVVGTAAAIVLAAPACALAETFTVHGTATGDSGVPLSGVTVAVFDASAPTGNPLWTGTTGADGSYTTGTNIFTAGVTAIVVDFAPTKNTPGNYLNTWYQGAATEANATQVAVSDGGTYGVGAVLRDGGIFKGQVKDAVTCAAIPDASVRLEDQNNYLLASMNTDANGNYQFNRIDTSSFKVIFSAVGYTNQVFNVSVTAGQTTTQNALLVPGGGASGSGCSGGGSSGGGSGGGSGGSSTVTPAQLTALLKSEVAPSKRVRIRALLNAGGLTYTFKALEAGRAVISWYQLPPGAHVASGGTKPKPVLVAKGALTFAAAGTVKLRVKLTARGRELLAHSKSIHITARGSFTPTGKPAITAVKRFTLER